MNFTIMNRMKTPVHKQTEDTTYKNYVWAMWLQYLHNCGFVRQ